MDGLGEMRAHLTGVLRADDDSGGAGRVALGSSRDAHGADRTALLGLADNVVGGNILVASNGLADARLDGLHGAERPAPTDCS